MPPESREEVVEMLGSLRQHKVARVVFDEYHREAWTVRPEVAARLRPGHPAGSSYAAAAAELAARDFKVAVNTDGPLTAEALQGADALVLAHPSGAGRDRAVGDGPPALAPEELAAVEAFVARGGGLVVLGDAGDDEGDGVLNEVVRPFGLSLGSAAVEDHGRDTGAPLPVAAERAAGTARPELLHLVEDARLYRAGTVTATEPGAVVLATAAGAQPPLAGLLAAVTHGDGRVVAVAGSDLFSDDAIAWGDHRRLWLNVVYWATAHAFRAEPTPLVSETAHDAAWLRLRDATNALRALQEPRGDVDLDRHDEQEVRGLVAAMLESIAALAPRFPHEEAYLAQVRADLRRWLDEGCPRPDFGASLAQFHPERHRRDGIEHLVVFPMYTPNGSPDTRFEALLVRTPWPDFIDALERGPFDNPKYVPVQLVDHTDGYASECAVLFPETVSVAARPTNAYGGIFCDREAARYRRSLAAGAELLRIQLPPDAAAFASNGDLVREAYILWDMIHDRWHSHGDLPFDPFMIRQRLPYWMYSLEELRVDLATYGTAGELVRGGFPFARYVQYAILFDRILRFPVTGSRVRNYDGLGGQLLFAYLHRHGVLQWTDNRLIVDWRRVEQAVGELRERIEELYRMGIDLSRVSYWIEAHDLIAGYVRPNVLSRWARENRVNSDEADVRAWIDRVLNDEFPLSMFYEQLKKKLGDRAAAEAAAGTAAARSAAPAAEPAAPREEAA